MVVIFSISRKNARSWGDGQLTGRSGFSTAPPLSHEHHAGNSQRLADKKLDKIGFRGMMVDAPVPLGSGGAASAEPAESELRVWATP